MSPSQAETGVTTRRVLDQKSARGRPCRTGETAARMRFACGVARRHFVLTNNIGRC